MNSIDKKTYAKDELDAKERGRAAVRRYRSSEKGIEWRERYKNSEQAKESSRAAGRRYSATEHGRKVLAEKQRRRRAANAEYQKAWRDKNPDKVREIQRRRLLSNSYLKRRCAKYGISVEQYLAMVDRQEGRCAICKEPPSERSPLCIDHCHDTGIVRGLLCKVCNLAVGNLRNSADVALSAAIYLEMAIP